MYKKFFRLILAISVVMGLAVILIGSVLYLAHEASRTVLAAPIDPPAGYPKLTLSTKSVSPTLAATDGATLTYRIEIVNTGASPAEAVSLVDPLPANTTYNGDASSSVPPMPVFTNGRLTWLGDVGFDSSAVISFSVTVDAGFSGTVTNTAVIDQALIPQPVTVTAESVVTDNPILTIDKSGSPEIPGANKLLEYALTVTNQGQAAISLPITVTDVVPENTTLNQVGPGGFSNGGVVTWTRSVTLEFGDTSVFTFNVIVDDVPSGTVLSNLEYQVDDPSGATSAGVVYTTTVLDPIFSLHKTADPHPPGSNREMTYTLTVLNQGSLATDLVVTDRVPDGVTYLRGGSLTGDIVSWDWPSLDTGESARFTYTVFVGDMAAVDVINLEYDACSAEGVCESGEPLTSTVEGPTFAAEIELDPIAKKPGGGGGPVTPTLTLHNLGPGSALEATALITFGRISVSSNDFFVTPPTGMLSDGPECGDKCVAYIWIGDLAAGETITFTTLEGQSTIGGEEGTIYTATLIVTDTLGDFTTEPLTVTAYGKVTHYANLIPEKTGPTVIGAGQDMTYTIQVFNSGLSTDVPPFPVLTETLPASVTLVRVNDGGEWQTIGGQTTISWSLPSMGPGEITHTSFVVNVNEGLVSGTLIVNDDYRVTWNDLGPTSTVVLSNTGVPFTTTVREIGLVDSFKTVTPTLAFPGEGIYLTYTVHVYNSSPEPLYDVVVYDLLPWESSTYQRDAIASSGQLVSDIISIDWEGDVAPFSTEMITLTVLVDPFYEGPVTNTATIQHPSLQEDKIVQAVAYITDDPVLRIRKSDSPDPVKQGSDLLYTLYVTNLGQQATGLVVTDTVPTNTLYVEGSASAGGQLDGNQVRWEFPVLLPGETQLLTFKVTVVDGEVVVNEDYAVHCAEGVSAVGEAVWTTVISTQTKLFLPLIAR